MVAGKSPDQICRMDSRGCFVEVRSCMFSPKKEGKLGKVLFNFVTYDEKTNKQTKSIPIYIDIPKMLVLTDDIRLGFFRQKMKEEIKRCLAAGDKYCKAIWEDLGGTSVAGLNAGNRPRPDGKAESRIMEIVPAAKEEHVLIRAKRGPGNEMAKGLIAPDYKAGKFEQIDILVSLQELRAMAKLVDINITAYEGRKWAIGEHDLSYNTQQTQSSPYEGMADSGYYTSNSAKKQDAPQKEQPTQRQQTSKQQTGDNPYSPASQGYGNNVTPFAAPSDSELSDEGFNPFLMPA